MAGWKQQARQYGRVNAKSLSVLAQDQKPPEKKVIDAYRTKEQADVCLGCSKTVCTGSPECFRKRRKELTCAKSEESSATR